MELRIDYSVASSEQIVQALGDRIQQIRLSRNLTQAMLANEAGVSARTIRNLEHGESISLLTFVRVLSALGVQQNLAMLLPDPTVRPVDRIAGNVTPRQRARPSAAPAEETRWTWGDEDQ